MRYWHIGEGQKVMFVWDSVDEQMYSSSDAGLSPVQMSIHGLDKMFPGLRVIKKTREVDVDDVETPAVHFHTIGPKENDHGKQAQ